MIVASSCSTTISVLPEVAQPDQRVDQPAVVALVQADRGLVEDVEHADQARCRSAWPAGCAGPRRRPACRAARSRRQVVEADVDQELEPGADLLQEPLGDHVLAFGEAHVVDEGEGVTDRQLA